jgi:hypothetical protein
MRCGGGFGVALLRDEDGAEATTRDKEDCDERMAMTGHGGFRGVEILDTLSAHPST